MIDPPPRPIPELERPKQFTYQVAAMHAGVYHRGPWDSDKFEVTGEMLEKAAPTMIYRPLRLNHEQWLPFPDNRCENFLYGDGLLCGTITVTEAIDSKIQSGEILFLSCDFIRFPEQIVFHGLSLLTRGNPPQDKHAVIIPSSRIPVMEHPNMITSSQEVKLAMYETDTKTAEALVFAAKERFSLSDDDCFELGPEAITALGLSAVHLYARDKATDPRLAAWNEWRASQYATIAAAHSMAKIEALATEAEAQEALQILEMVS